MQLCLPPALELESHRNVGLDVRFEMTLKPYNPHQFQASFLVRRIRHFVLLVNILSHFYISRSAIKMRTKHKQRIYVITLTHPCSGQEPTWGSSWPTALREKCRPQINLVLAGCACCENIGSIFVPGSDHVSTSRSHAHFHNLAVHIQVVRILSKRPGSGLRLIPT